MGLDSEVRQEQEKRNYHLLSIATPSDLENIGERERGGLESKNPAKMEAVLAQTTLGRYLIVM
jgi:hypothetical protein